ncbi:hypothetical protein NDU88_006070 [Pleurodeles waltl]|uniref:Uncharacterized protein n=1 Tax=Pleurodeles waltl TaxID=8319 RepID=A0AAV7X0K2_PLEWA|nr:hypothetical protein NDU88_006070 [Pleurodeles waltl]
MYWASAPVVRDGDTRNPRPSDQCPRSTVKREILTYPGVLDSVMGEDTPGEGSTGRRDRKAYWGETEVVGQSREKASDGGKRQGEGQHEEDGRRTSPSPWSRRHQEPSGRAGKEKEATER